MSALAQLQIVDLRAALPQPRTIATATGRPQRRRNSTQYAVLHYNGPEAPARAGGTRSEIVSWLREVIIPNHIQRIGADGIQYHFWIARDGTVYQLRDIDMLLWHCGGKINNTSIAVHTPIGGHQQPTNSQWQSATGILDAICIDYEFTRASVKGHQECGQSECPGVVLMPMLRSWRNNTAATRYIVKSGGGTLRSSPHRDNKNVIRSVPPGVDVFITSSVTGESVQGNAVWYCTQDREYIHSSAVEKVG